MLGQVGSPYLHQPHPVGLGDAKPLRQDQLVVDQHDLVQVLCRQQLVQLVPLDLQGDQLRDDIVDVGEAGNVDRQRLHAIEVIPAAAARSALHLPILDVDVQGTLEDRGRLPKEDPANRRDGGRQAPQRIDECSGIGLGRSGLRVQAGLHPDVRLLENLQLGLARATEQSCVGPGVELDGFPARTALCGIGHREGHCPYYPARRSKPATDRFPFTSG